MKFFFILVFLPFGIFAQGIDSLSQPHNTIPVLKQTLPQKRRPAEVLIAPVAYIGYGFITLNSDPLKRFDHFISDDIREDRSHPITNIEDQLQFLPAVSVYTLGMLGVKGKNNFADKTALYFIASSLTNLSVNFIKTQTHKLRPDGSDYRSFPSGHTATAFVAAEFMNREYRDISPWYGIAGYTIATTTGALRIVNNKHWFSDVVAGAGLGIMSAKFTYLMYPLLKKELSGKNNGLFIIPVYQPGLVGFSTSLSLK